MLRGLTANADDCRSAAPKGAHLSGRQAKGNEAISPPESIDPNRLNFVCRIDWCLDLPCLMQPSVLQDTAIDVLGVVSPSCCPDTDDWW